MNKFMKLAIEEANKGIEKGEGGPFGTVIVDKNGNVIAKGHNLVLKNNDPTAHGEITAIRKACDKLETFDLSNCELYTTGEPCPSAYAHVCGQISKRSIMVQQLAIMGRLALEINVLINSLAEEKMFKNILFKLIAINVLNYLINTRI